MRKLGRLVTLTAVFAVTPILAIACGGSSDSGGSGGSSATGGADSGLGGTAAGGGGGIAAGGSGGTAATGGAGTGGTGATGGGGTGGVANECSPAPSDPGGAGGQAQDGGASDAGTPDSGPATEAGAGSIACGSATCNSLSIQGVITLQPCCAVTGCGLVVDSTVSGFIGVDPGCYGLDQPGSADSTCPQFSIANPLGGGNIDFPGCCHPDGTCGFAMDLTSFGQGAPNLGCVQQTCTGGAAKSCTP
ncbi:MAG: hypothetical protein KC776_15515 [Myxococcales bacterium]|nr:hypothetical protein [Myxococcales bacterium]